MAGHAVEVHVAAVLEPTVLEQEVGAGGADVDSGALAGIAVIAATGNDSARGRVGTPSCITGVVAVGNSIDPNDTLAPTSNHSPRVDLLAPGTNINAAVPTRNGQAAYATKTGTSQASPHVAGAWALLKSAKPTASVTT